MIERNWKFLQNFHGDAINHANARSLWYWGSGKYFWQYYRCPCLNELKFPSFIGTKKELKEFLEQK